MAEEWQTPKFRQSIIARITDLLSQSPGQDTNKAGVMESHIFNKSRTKDEYTGLVSKLFLHFKDMAQRRPQHKQQQQQQQQAPNPEMSQQPIQDPLNALQNLATQGNRNPQMMSMPGAGGGPGGGGPNQMGGPGGPVPASSLLANLNQQRSGQQQQQQQMQQQMQGIRSQLPMNAGGGGGGPGGPNQQIMPGGGPSGPGNVVGMPMNVMGGGGGPGGGGPQGGPNVGPQQQQQMNAMAGHPNQMGPGNAGQNAGGVGGGPGGPGGGGPGGPVQMNAMNVQQMQQMNQNQMAQMGMNHPQLNQMINARMAQNVQGGNAQGPGGMQQQGPGGMISGGPQQQGGGPGGQPGNLNQMLNMQQKGNMPMGGQPGQMFPVNRNMPGQAPFLRQSPSPSMVASPAGGMGPGQVQQQQLQQQQQMQQQQNQIPGGPVSGGSATGPVGNAGVGGPNQQQQQQQQQQQVPTPNSQMGNAQMIPSPALVPSPSPQMSNLMQNNQRQMRQSPSAPLNTPGQVASNSPFNPQEEQLYREKYKQLTKYIEPLKRMVAKIGIDGQNSEKMTKMSKLLEILSSPTQLVPLETLLKCEKALEKMELVYTGQQFGKSSNPLMEVINATLQSPIANHTLHRTFRPSLEVLFGTDICAPSAPKKAKLQELPLSETDHEIPHVLQGEIARLDQKFKVTLDTAMPTNRKEIHLICCLDDHRLPSVPPLYATIPEDYPYVSPECQLHKGDYLSTKFMTAVYYAFSARLSKMSRLYSLSQVLDTWEMSVRHGCSPNAKPMGDLLAVCNG